MSLYTIYIFIIITTPVAASQTYNTNSKNIFMTDLIKLRKSGCHANSLCEMTGEEEKQISSNSLR